MALEPDEAAVGGQLGETLRLAEIGQHAEQLPGRFACVEDLLGVGGARRGGERRRQEYAVAVDDVGAGRLGLADDATMREAGVAGRLDHRHVDEAQGDDGKGDDEQCGGDEQAGAADLERLLRRLVERDRGAGRRPEVPWLARVVVVRAALRLHRSILSLAFAKVVAASGRGGFAVGTGGSVSGSGAPESAIGTALGRIGMVAICPRWLVPSGTRSRWRRLRSASRLGWLRKGHSPLSTWVASWSARIARLARASASSRSMTSYFTLNMPKPTKATRTSQSAVPRRIMRPPSGPDGPGRRPERPARRCARRRAGVPSGRADCARAPPRRDGSASSSAGENSPPDRASRRAGDANRAVPSCCAGGRIP